MPGAYRFSAWPTARPDSPLKSPHMCYHAWRNPDNMFHGCVVTINGVKHIHEAKHDAIIANLTADTGAPKRRKIAKRRTRAASSEGVRAAREG